MVAAIESGLAKLYRYTRFTGEKSNDPPYKDQAREVGGVLLPLIENYDLPKTDLESFCERANELHKTCILNHKERSPVHLCDVLILDIPLHRNSTAAARLSTIKEEKKAKEFAENCDAVPLGRSDATVRMLNYYQAVRDFHIVAGGAMIVKVIEPWEGSVVKAMYNLVKPFGRVQIVTNPYSGSSSKEVYMVCQDYHCPEYLINLSHKVRIAEKGIDLHKAVSYVHREVLPKPVFYSMVYSFNNLHMVKITYSLMELTRRYGRVCLASRKIICRCALLMRSSIRLFPKLKLKYLPTPNDMNVASTNQYVISDLDRRIFVSRTLANTYKIDISVCNDLLITQNLPYDEVMRRLWKLGVERRGTAVFSLITCDGEQLVYDQKKEPEGYEKVVNDLEYKYHDVKTVVLATGVSNHLAELSLLNNFNKTVDAIQAILDSPINYEHSSVYK